MAIYNPNSIWGSKKKEYSYDGKGPQPGSLTGPNPEAHAQAVDQLQAQKLAAEKQPLIPGSGTGDSGGKKGGIFKDHGLAWFAGGLVFLLVALGIVVFVLKNHPVPNVAINFTEPSQVLVGDPFIFTVSVTNNSNQTLSGANLSVLVPQGISFIDATTTGQQVMADSLGNLAPGGVSTQTFNMIVTDNPNTIDHVTATVLYGANGNTSAQYETNGESDIDVGSAAAQFTFNGIQNVFSGQNFNIVVNYQNQSPEDIADAQFQVVYPPAFSFVTSSIPLFGSGNDLWDLGPVSAGASSSFTITGNITGPASTPYALTGTLNGNFQGSVYPIYTQNTDVTIASAPLSISIALNNSSSYVANAGDELNYVLTYANNSNVTFQGVTITAKLTGSMFDFSKLNTDGSFNSGSNTITWNAASEPQLAALAPGTSGSLNFTINAKNTFPINLVSDKDFLLKTLATIQSPTVPPNTAGGTGTQSITELDTKVAGLASITSNGYYHDPSGIENSGPYPPIVNKPTEYTIHWLVTNYSTDLSNVTVSAYLQSGSSFTGTVKSSLPSSTPTYDPSTGLVSWTIPFIPATTGVLGKPLEATFQISNTPAVNQVDQIVTLLGPTTLTGTDNFTGNILTETAQAVTTELPNDPSVNNISNKTVSQ